MPELSPAQWESLLSQARCARLAPRLALLCVERGWIDAVPARPRVHLDNALAQGRRQHDQTLWEARCIRDALAQLPGPVVLLKGAAYVVARLQAGRGRLFTDVDVMVPAAQLRVAEAALFAAGWYAAPLDPYDERYYRDWMHEVPPMQHVERGTALDLHHTITPPTSRFAVDAARLFERARALEASPGLWVLAPEDMVLHGVVHLLQDGDYSAGLRDLLDFDALTREFGADPAFWPRLVERALELGLQATLYHAVAQARRLLATPVPAAAAAALEAQRPGRLRRATMAALLRAALRPDHPDCDTPLTPAVRWLLYVRSHGLRMPWYMILPHLLRKAWMRRAALIHPAEKRAPL
ncbi:MAG: nucleotidyltransferase family protein [Burkholderiales bacterium]|nr:nucleotidyltransferase family protein [Burkholderiales bacterium]MDE2160397.1 nucleotidyltransferase family protein [Burkholderiales bacterium]